MLRWRTTWEWLMEAAEGWIFGISEQNFAKHESSKSVSLWSVAIAYSVDSREHLKQKNQQTNLFNLLILIVLRIAAEREGFEPPDP